MSVFRDVVITLAILVAAFVAACIGAGLLAQAGALGSCFEGSCGYVAVLVALPLLWLLFGALGIAARVALRRRLQRRRTANGPRST